MKRTASSASAAPENASANQSLPKWFTEDLVIPLQAGIAHEFIVHGDVNCLVQNPDIDDGSGGYITLRKFFEKLLDERPMVIFYNIASGMQFLDPKMEKEFKRIAGLEEKPDVSDPVAAAKAGLQAKRGLPREPEACLPLMEKVLKGKEGVAIVMQSVHFIAVSNGSGGALLPAERINIERLKNWAQDEEIRSKGNVIILLTDQAAKVSPELRQSGVGTRTVFIPKPDKKGRLDYVRSITGTDSDRSAMQEELSKKMGMLNGAKNSAEIKKLAEEIERLENELKKPREGTFSVPKDFDAEIFANATQGLSLRQILEIFLHCEDTGFEIDLPKVKQRKRELLMEEFGDIMEIVEPERGLDDIGGHEHIKEYFRGVLEALRKGESRLVPMGTTLMGPPGTGKTALVEALAKEAGFNFVKTKNVRSMWVGQSEANAERLEFGLRSLAPVVVMNDEADLAEAGRDSPRGDSGVSERLMKKWMELLSDPNIRGKIVVINCTNRPDRIDPALKRSGRSDERILMPMPGDDERAVIFKVMFKRHSLPCSIKDFDQFVKLSDGLSGADIEKIVLSSFRFASRSGKASVDAKSLEAAINDFIPSASQSEIDRMTLMGLAECSSRELLPKNIRSIIKKIEERRLVEGIDQYIAQLKNRRII